MIRNKATKVIFGQVKFQKIRNKKSGNSLKEACEYCDLLLFHFFFYPCIEVLSENLKSYKTLYFLFLVYPTDGCSPRFHMLFPALEMPPDYLLSLKPISKIFVHFLEHYLFFSLEFLFILLSRILLSIIKLRLHLSWSVCAFLCLRLK